MALRTQPTAKPRGTDHYDVIVIVIGSGAGGGTLTHALAPTLTIIANALRVADHITVRLGATSQPEARPEPVPAHA